MPCVRAGIALRLLIDGSHLLLSFLEAQPMQDVINVIDEKLNEHGAKAIEIFQKTFFENLKKNENWNEEKREYKKVKVELIEQGNTNKEDIAKLIVSNGRGVNSINIVKSEDSVLSTITIATR